MIRRILLLLCLAAPAWAQPVQQLPDVGQWIMRSRDAVNLTSNCQLTIDKASKMLRCLGPLTTSIYRTADSFSPATTAGLDCPGSVCRLLFPDSGPAKFAYLDWIMPSEALEPQTLLLSWQAGTSGATMTWTVDWCVYKVGEATCTPDGSQRISAESAASGANTRTDVVLNPFSPNWPPDYHVVLQVSRTIGAGTLVGDARLEGLRLELIRPED